jgi:hypothetical protein
VAWGSTLVLITEVLSLFRLFSREPLIAAVSRSSPHG